MPNWTQLGFNLDMEKIPQTYTLVGGFVLHVGIIREMVWWCIIHE